jgi:hypothetical protein
MQGYRPDLAGTDQRVDQRRPAFPAEEPLRQPGRLVGVQHLTHAHTHTQGYIYIGGGVGTLASIEEAPEVVALVWRGERFQLRHERLGGGLRGHVQGSLT